MAWRAALLALALLAPVALASAAPGATLAWSPGWARPESPRAVAACASGDADADGAPDLLLLGRGLDGAPLLRALRGPAFVEPLWTLRLDAGVAIACGADLQGDGVADPILSELRWSDAAPDAPVRAAEAAGRLLALDGASGAALVALDAHASGRGTASGGATTSAALSPAAPGLLLHAREEATLVALALPVLGDVLQIRRASAHLELLASDGRVVGSVAARDPHAEVLAYAAVPDPEGARVLVLTAVDASPADEAAARVVTLTAYAQSGARLWAYEHDLSAATPLLLPQAGDLDADGIADLVVQMVPTDLHASGEASVTVLSGVDGATLFADRAASGLVMALPMGAARGAVGDALLVARQLAPGAPLALERVVDGKVAWTIGVAAEARPVNLARDRFTGDVTGFTDLTGDGVADLALLLRVGSSARLDVIDGETGERAWSRPVPPDAEVVPITGRDGADDLLVVDRDDDRAEITRLDGADGGPHWTSGGPVPSGDGAGVQTEPVVGDGDEDVLMRVDDGKGGSAVHVIDGADGRSAWTGSTDEGGAPPGPLAPQGASPERGGPGRGVAGPAATLGLLGALALVGASAHLRRR